MKLIKLFVLIISISFIMTLNAFAEEIKLIASVDKTVLTTIDTLNITLTVKGSTNTPQPTLPDFQGLDLIFGPNISSQTTIVNGAVSFSKGFSYVLKPKSPGKFTIGEFTLNHKGKIYKSNTITINVIDKDKADAKQPKGDVRDISLDEKVFVEFTTDKPEVYTYEQVILTFKFFYQRGLPITDVEYVEPEIRNFFKEDMGQQRNYEVVRNGMIFNVIELNTALFPVISGELVINPAKLKCNIVVKNNRRRTRRNSFGDSFFDDFFGDNQTKYALEREAKAIKLPVKELPTEGRPSDFNGAVGDYSMAFEVQPTKVAIGDPITLTMRVKGLGNLQTISEPVLTQFEKKEFKVYPSEIDAKITAKTKNIRGYKLFRKVIEVQSQDVKQTPGVSFSFFSPKSNKYETISYKPVAVEVEEADTEAPLRLYMREGLLADKDQVEIITKDILPIMTNLADFKNQNNLLYKSRVIYVIFFTPIVIVLASIFIKNYQSKLKSDVGFARKRQAQTGARKRLVEARNLMSNGTAEEFYSTLSNAIAEYIANKLNITTAAVSPSSLPGLLGNENIDSEVIDRLVKLRELCDFGRFAKASAAKETIQGALSSGEELINVLEKQLK